MNCIWVDILAVEIISDCFRCIEYTEMKNLHENHWVAFNGAKNIKVDNLQVFKVLLGEFYAN